MKVTLPRQIQRSVVWQLVQEVPGAPHLVVVFIHQSVRLTRHVIHLQEDTGINKVYSIEFNTERRSRVRHHIETEGNKQPLM